MAAWRRISSIGDQAAQLSLQSTTHDLSLVMTLDLELPFNVFD
jgi:hypothetical protein